MKRNWQTRAVLSSVLALTPAPLLAKNNNAAAPAPHRHRGRPKHWRTLATNA